MNIILILVICGITITLSEAASRSKRAAYDLPDGVELIVGGVRTTFVCSTDGYYADIDNNCQIFHVCQTVTHPDGVTEMLQWSFFCGNQTVFNQASFTCAWPEDAIPCGSSRDFYYLNSNIGAGPNVPFLTEQDVARADAVKPARSYQPAVAQPRPPPRGGGGGGFRG